MATERLIIEVQSRGIRRVNRNLQNLQRQAKSSTTVLQQLRNALVVVAAVRVIRRFTDLADSFVNLRNRLQATLGTFEAAVSAQRELVQIARETRTGIDQTGDAFARLALGAQDLGLSTQTLLDVTRTLNQAIILSGTTSQEARNALIQLSQGIASGALRGDELRSVLEQLPLVARLIADEFEVPIGQLRTLGEEGALTTERIIAALQNAAPEIQRQFGNTVTTIDQALTGLTTNFTVFINQLFDAAGVSQGLVGGITAVAESFEFLADNIGLVTGSLTTLISLLAVQGVAALVRFAATFRIVQTAVIATAGSTSVLNTALVFTTTIFRSLTAAIAANPIGLIAVGVSVALGAIVGLNSATETYDETLNDLNQTLERNRTILDQNAVSSAKVAREGIKAALAARQEAVAQLELARARELADDALGERSFIGGESPEAERIRELEAAIAEANQQIATFRGEFQRLDRVEQEAALNAAANTKELEKQKDVIADLEFELAQLNRTARDQAIAEALRSANLEFDAVGPNADRIRELAAAIFDVNEALEEQADRAKEAEEAIAANVDRARDLFERNLPLQERAARLDEELAATREVLQKLTGDTAEAEMILARAREEGLQAIEEEIGGELLDFRREQASLTEQLATNTARFNEIKAISIQLGNSEADAIAEANRFIDEQNRLLIENSEARQAANQFFTAEAGIREFTELQAELSRNGEAAGLSIQQQNELLRAQARELAGASNAALEFSEAQKALNFAVEQGAVSSEEAIDLARRNRIELLESRRTFEAGAERSFLKFIEDATDAAAQTEELFTNTFNELEDIIFNFVKTGELNFQSLFQTISDGLIRIGIQQALGAAGGGFGGLIGGTAGTGGGGGAAGGFGGLVAQGLGGLFGFQQGGSFRVGANSAVASLPGIDNRLVAFRARDGEEVSVTPRDRPSPMAAPVNQVFNIQTPDADSFRFSQPQIQARAVAGIDQSRRRRR